MTQDIRKPNDIFVSAIINPTANVSTLMFNGLNTENTGLLAPEVYRNSKFVQDAFKMGDGGFNEELFEKTYMYASQMYDQMATVKSTKELSKFAQYNPRDIYAPFDSQKVKPSYSIQQIENPLRTSRGVKHLFGEGDQTKSWRELAQQSKVIDYETGEPHTAHTTNPVPLWLISEKYKSAIFALLNHLPHFQTPLICIFQQKITAKAKPNF